MANSEQASTDRFGMCEEIWYNLSYESQPRHGQLNPPGETPIRKTPIRPKQQQPAARGRMTRKKITSRQVTSNPPAIGEANASGGSAQGRIMATELEPPLGWSGAERRGGIRGRREEGAGTYRGSGARRGGSRRARPRCPSRRPPARPRER